jgi:hypothetical protein
MPAIKGSEITKLSRGQSVWMIVNGEPALRYFVEFHSEGCLVAIDPDLKQAYYDTLAYFFKSEESILLLFIEGLTERITNAASDINGYRRRLAELRAKGSPAMAPGMR